MDRNTAQLNQDYGVQVGTIGGIPVMGPADDPANGDAFNLVYDSTDKVYNLTKVAAGG